MIAFNPKAKILAYIGLVLLVFLLNSFEINIALLGVVFICALKAPFSSLKKGYIPIIFFLAFTFFSNTLFQTGRVIYEILGITVTEEGLKKGGYLTLRLFTLILGAKVLTAATPAEDLVKAMAGLMGPVGRLGPVKDFIFTTALTLRFLPMIYNEAQMLYKETIKNSPGATFIDKIRLSVSLLIPLFDRSIKKARELSKINNNEHYNRRRF